MNLQFIFIIGAVAGMLGAGSVSAEVLLTEAAALARVFPGSAPARRTLYLKSAQVAAVETLAHSRLPSPVVTVFRGRSPGGEDLNAILDTHVVRTMPETVMAVAGPGGDLRMALVLQFGEPPDYLPREGWLRTLEGRPLDDDLWPGRGVRRVSGSTLTVQAISEAVRRCLAIDALVLRGVQ
jgi:hypothetical protein